jgi:hypothetical protein
LILVLVGVVVDVEKDKARDGRARTYEIEDGENREDVGK